jgi:CRISPR-associated protein Csm1
MGIDFMKTEWIVSPPHRRAYTIAAAGLLHDIGKLLEPAGVELSQQTRNLAQMFCPTDAASQKSTHQHVLYSSHAFEQIQSNFGGLDRQQIHDIAMHHHRPSPGQLDQQILTRADWTASGNDRAFVPQDQEQQVNGMLSILSRVDWPELVPKGLSESVWMPTATMSFGNELLPQSKTDRSTYGDRCSSMVEPLLQALSIQSGSPSDWMLKVLTILERYLHAIPASRYRRHQPDVSLFDHSRSVSAFGSCLAVQFSEGRPDASSMQGRYRLLTLAAGGIQSFLFRKLPVMNRGTQESGDKGIGKQLRARSFYVAMLVRLASQRVLDAAGLPPVNLVLDAGGRCVLLLPDVSETVEAVQSVLRQIDHWIAQNLGGVLRLDIAMSESLGDGDFALGKFSATYRDLDDRLAQSRFRWPVPVLKSQDAWSEEGWVMGQDSAATKRVSLPVDREEFSDRIIRFGQQLPKNSIVAVDVVDRGPDRGNADLDLLGYRVSLHRSIPDTGQPFAIAEFERWGSLPAIVTAARVPEITQQNLTLLSSLPADVYSESRDRKVEQLLTFEELAHMSVDDAGHRLGHPMLAVLKADVDRLGMILGYGLGENVSLGRYASLSRQLDTFFKGYLTRKLELTFPGIYTVFAGGDDLFLIGPWYDIARFARSLHGWFQQLVSHNSNLTFSAGIVFAPAGIPVSHLAEHGEEALEKAKHLGRDRITVGSVTLTWKEFTQAWELHQQMLSAAETSSGLNSSMAYRLLQYAKMGLGILPGRRFGQRNPLDLKWRSQLNYDLKRNLPVRENEPEKNPVRQLRCRLIELAPADLPVLHVASTLTLYFLRGKNS